MRFDDFFARFILVFGTIYIGFHLADLAVLKAVVARGSWLLLSAWTDAIELSGFSLLGQDIAFHVVTSCTGVVSFAIFAGLLYATKVNNKALYLLIAAPLFVLENIGRVTATMLVPEHVVVHNLLWLFSAVLILVLYLWVLKREKAFPQRGCAPSTPRA